MRCPSTPSKWQRRWHTFPLPSRHLCEPRPHRRLELDLCRVAALLDRAWLSAYEITAMTRLVTLLRTCIPHVHAYTQTHYHALVQAKFCVLSDYSLVHVPTCRIIGKPLSHTSLIAAGPFPVFHSAWLIVGWSGN